MALLARPMARPRRVSNQRAITAEPAARPAPPEPSATRIPAVTYTCQSWLTNAELIAPAPRRAIDTVITRRAPHRSARRRASGLTVPRRRREIAATSERAARDHPNSVSMGLTYTPNALRTPDAVIIARATANMTNQAGWKRGCLTVHEMLCPRGAF